MKHVEVAANDRIPRILHKKLDYSRFSSVCRATSKRLDIGKLFADVTAAYEDAVGVALEGQGRDLSPKEARLLYSDLGLLLAHLVELHARIAAFFGTSQRLAGLGCRTERYCQRSVSPGMAGLRSIQGEGLAFARRVETTMQTSPDTSQANENSKLTSTKVTRVLQLRKLLKRKSGVTRAELQKTFLWQTYTARATISGQRKSGATIDRTTGKNLSFYRMVEEGGA